MYITAEWLYLYSALLNFRLTGNCTLTTQGRWKPISLIPWNKRYTIRFLPFVYTRQVTRFYKRDGISTDAKACLMRSLTDVCRRDLPAIFDNWGHIFQDFTPQTQSYGEHTGVPRRNAIAIQSDEASKRVPNEEQGRACKNAPKEGATAAIKMGFPAWIQRSRITFTNGESQNFRFATKGGWTTTIMYRRKKHAGRATWPKILHPYFCT